MSDEISEIGGGIYISGIDAAQSEPTNHLDNVLSVCQDTCLNNVGGADYYHMSLADDVRSAEQYGGSCSYESFEKAVRTLERIHTPFEDNTLVHCHKGRNRSVSVVCAYNAALSLASVAESFETIKECRPQVDPNDRMYSYACRYAYENHSDIRKVYQ